MDLIEMNELKHHGVLGMKWGVRKDRELKGRSSTSKKKKKAAGSQIQKEAKARAPASDDYINKLRTKNKELSSLTNAELRAFNERMQLEMTYKKLTAKPKNKAVSIVSSILADAAKDTAKHYVKEYMKAGVEALKKKA